MSQQRAGSRGRVPYDKYASATQFYEEKLQNNPTMPRYNHFMGAIHSEKGNSELAEKYYRQTIATTPNDIMARNDFAIHLAKQDRKQDALQEFKKAALITEENSVLQKNMGAVVGNYGDYKRAMDHATRARHLNPYDAMNHRNIAKLHNALGDSRSSLEHNMTSLRLERPVLNSAGTGYVTSAGTKPVTSAYRAAAVQIIAKGGSRDEAYKLMDVARTLENKTFVLDTTQRTNEIIYKAMKRMGDQVGKIQNEHNAEAEKKRIAEIRFDNKDDILKFTAGLGAKDKNEDDEDGNGNEKVSPKKKRGGVKGGAH